MDEPPFEIVVADPDPSESPATRRRLFRDRVIAESLSDLKTAALYYRPAPALLAAINTALAVGAPLLLAGEPGTGKTQVAFYLGEYFATPVLPLFVRSDTTTADLLYRFDAVAYFQAANDPGRRNVQRKEFVSPSVLWEAYESPTPRIVLIDEIDKAPRDFPNDVLHALDQHEFYVPEAERWVRRKPNVAPPMVVVTTNDERRMPDAFLRRCIFHWIELTEDLVRRAVQAHVGDFPRLEEQTREVAIQRFLELRALKLRKRPATAELLVWLAVLSAQGVTSGSLGVRLRELPALGVLLKDRDDLGLL